MSSFGLPLIALFLSTPSARRATGQHGGALRNHDISIHALREESDLPVLPEQPIGNEFLSTPSARRATHTQAMAIPTAKFLSTPSARRATYKSWLCHVLVPISIHALREEGDARGPSRRGCRSISIHALREEGDVGE